MRFVKFLLPLLIITLFSSCGSPFYDPAYMNSAYLTNKMDFRGSYNNFPSGFDFKSLQEQIYRQNSAIFVSSTYPNRYASFINASTESFFRNENGEYVELSTNLTTSSGMEYQSGPQSMIVFPIADNTLSMGKGYIVMKWNFLTPLPPAATPPHSEMAALGYTYTDLNTGTYAPIYLWSWEQDITLNQQWDNANPSSTAPAATDEHWAIDDSVGTLLGIDEVYILFQAMSTTQLNSGQRTLQAIVYDSLNNSVYEINQLLPLPGSYSRSGAVPQLATQITNIDPNWLTDYFQFSDAYQSYYAHDSQNERSVYSIYNNISNSFQTFGWSTKGSSPNSKSDINRLYNVPPRAHVAATLSTGDIIFMSKSIDKDGDSYSLLLLEDLSNFKRLNCGYLIFVGETIIDGVPTTIFNMATEEHDKDNNIRKISVYTIPTEDLLKLF